LVAPRVGRPKQAVRNVNPVKRGPLVRLWVKYVHRVMLVNTAQVKMLKVILRIRLYVLIAPRVGRPKQAAPSVNRVKRGQLVRLWVKSVAIVVRVSTVPVKMTMAPLPTQLNALVAPRVGRPKQAAPNANRVKRGQLVRLWVKSVRFAARVNFVQAKKPMAPLPTPRNVLCVQLGTILIRGAQNVNSAVPEHTATLWVGRNAHVANWNTPEEAMTQMVHTARGAFWVKQRHHHVPQRVKSATLVHLVQQKVSAQLVLRANTKMAKVKRNVKIVQSTRMAWEKVNLRWQIVRNATRTAPRAHV